MKNNPNIIKCPYCDWEYLPGEIYIPNHLVGQPSDVVHKIDGTIDSYDGLDQSLQETFICDHCGKKFNITATLTFTTTKITDIKEHNYQTQKYKDRLILKEE